MGPRHQTPGKLRFLPLPCPASPDTALSVAVISGFGRAVGMGPHPPVWPSLVMHPTPTTHPTTEKTE